MRVDLRYGRGTLPVEIPERNLVAILRKKEVEPLPDPEGEVERALSEPIGAKPLSDIARGRRDACVVISDITRPVPNKVILPPLLRALEECGIPRERITILVATGMHRPTTDEELDWMVGEEIRRAYRIVNHNAKDESNLVYLGETSLGTPIWLNKLFYESDLKVLTGLIEPHFMAGYSGGRKAVCPGLVGVETMKVFHGPRHLEDPRAEAGILEGNPLHLDATEIARRAGVDFIVNVAVDEKRRVVGVFAGDLEEAFVEGVRFVEGCVKVEVSEPADIIVTSAGGYPLDATFYQTVKAMVVPLPAVKEGGTIIVASSLSEGIGGPEYTETLLSIDDIHKFTERLWEPGFFILDQWEIEEQAKALRKAKVMLYSDGLGAETLSKLFVEPVASVEEGIERALSEHGPDARIIAIPEGPYVMPVLAPKRARGIP